jgi:hypothetical protein
MEIDQVLMQIPVVTRTYMLCSAVLAAAVSFKFLSPLTLYWNWSLTTTRGEWWRPFTALVFVDEFGVNWFFMMHFIYFYWRHLEEHHYMRRSAEFLLFLIAASICVIAVNAIVFDGALAFLAHTLVDVVVYSWSRRFPDELLSFFGLVEFSSSYLPYVLVMWGATLRGFGALKVDIVAMVIGHVLWFVADVVPHVLGVRLLAPGDFITELLSRLGIGQRRGLVGQGLQEFQQQGPQQQQAQDQHVQPQQEPEPVAAM